MITDLIVTWYCREQLLHKLKLEEKEHEERLEREKSKKLAEFEVRRKEEGGGRGGKRERCGEEEGGGEVGGLIYSILGRKTNSQRSSVYFLTVLSLKILNLPQKFMLFDATKPHNVLKHTMHC